MRFEFDPAKSLVNERERGLPFAAAAQLFDSAILEWEDRRREYGETRFCALGEIGKRVFFVAFTRRKDSIRIISFRKANSGETRKYRQYVRGGGASDAH
ncbi:MAG TPA: BrnT family toxin [Micropepsaceae bacterium]|nr:BrnT family toxin [Micropepsaceae bacterium]